MSDESQGYQQPNEDASDRLMQAQLDSQAAFQRELRRRKRILWLYIGLLLIPVAVFFVVLIWGRTDQQVVKEAAADGVNAVVESRIIPVANDITAVQTELKRNEQQSRQWYDANKQQYETLQRLTTDFQQEFPIPPKELAETVTGLQGKQDDLSNNLVEFQKKTSAFQEEFTIPPSQLVQSVAGLQERTQSLTREIATRDERLMGRLSVIDKRQEDLTQNLTEFQKRISSQAENLPERVKSLESSVALIEAQRKTIDSLTERLMNLEAKTATIEKERTKDSETIKKMIRRIPAEGSTNPQ